MLRLGIFLAATVALSAAAPNPISNVLELDISPEDAQKYLNSPPFTEPKLSSRTAVLPLVKYNDPRFRTVEAGPTLGHYWKNGHEIENTEDYVEEVRYWADSQGFHQEDNIPKVVLKPVEEDEDVRQARLAHEKAWQEAAAAARQQPDPQGEYYGQYEIQSSASEVHPAYDVAPVLRQSRDVRDSYNYRPASGPSTEEPEPTGPPRGFFYQFDYPVSIIVPKSSLQGESVNPPKPY
ncbi:uncharacterized protein LOC125064257 isoform X2 [Vanessa atalanta]|uniref:uncharacterized protein LOC125064257 isoform X2 n=1 Tax=Vanessa atalanta TaxID=42275 RepID=UPI001FCE19B5|nr:uncharacterized protein LOC125064257 isoform X2 [Vanessa atalanta]